MAALDLITAPFRAGACSLDDLMRARQRPYGWFGPRSARRGRHRIAGRRACWLQPSLTFAACVHGTGDPPLAGAARRTRLRSIASGRGRHRQAAGPAGSGGRVVDAGLHDARWRGAARRARVRRYGRRRARGRTLSPLDGLRVQPRDFEHLLRALRAGGARRVASSGATADALPARTRRPLADTVWITPDPQADAEALQRRQAWLGGDRCVAGVSLERSGRGLESRRLRPQQITNNSGQGTP